MDDSAVSEAIAADGFLHWQVVSMSIDAKTIYFVMAEIKAGPGNAFGLTIGGNSVDGAIGLIGVPCTIFDDGIIRLSSYNKSKSADYFIWMVVWCADIIMVIGDILQNIFRCGIIAAPLGSIAVIGHKLSGIGVEGHNIFYIFFFGRSYMNHCVSSFLVGTKTIIIIEEI